MKVVVDKSLQDYMIKHDQYVLTLMMNQDYGMLSTNPAHPVVKHHAPRNPEHFEAYRVDNLTIYVEDKIVPESDVIELHDHVRLGLHSCQIKGIKQQEDHFLKLP
jgi:hypothetical protein